MRGLAFILLLGASVAAGAATLDPAAPPLGQPARLILETAPADSTLWPTGFNAAVRPTDDPRIFEFVALRVGRVGALLPATGDTLFAEVPTSIEEVRPEFLRPIHSVGEIGPRWGAAIALVVLVLALLAALVAWWIFRRRGGTVVAEAPPEPAEVVAMRDLDRLERERLVEAGRFEEFYVRGSHIVREYAGRRFGLRVLDYTTSETLDSMRASSEAADHVPAIAPLLNAADEVKFARHLPDPDDGGQWLRSARDFVAVTTPAPAPTDDESGSGGRGPKGSVAEVSA